MIDSLTLAALRIHVNLVFEDAAGILNETATAAYVLETNPATQRPGPETPSIAKAGNVFRVVQWNVADDGIRKQPGPYSRILAALKPDIILFDEVFGSVTPTDLERFFGQAPLGELGDWKFVLGRGGGRQKTVIATQAPIRAEESLLEVPYAPGALNRLDREFNQSSFTELLKLEEKRGLSAAGAWVEILGREILFVPLDLQSSGYDGSSEDRLRELQANTLHGRIFNVRGRSGAARHCRGDFNLVGFPEAAEYATARTRHRRFRPGDCRGLPADGSFPSHLARSATRCVDTGAAGLHAVRGRCSRG